MNRTRVRVTGIALVAAAVCGVACGGPVASKAVVAPVAAPAPKSASQPAVAGVPMVLETGIGAKPPTVKLIVASGTRHVAVSGRRFAAYWSTRSATTLQDLHFPVPWPRVSAVGNGPDPELVFDTPYQPDFVMMKAYSQIDPVSRTPSPAPDATFICYRFEAPHCKTAIEHSSLHVIGFGPRLFKGGYFIVFARWHIPRAALPAGPDASSDATVSWLFHVDAQRPPGASQQ